MRYRVNISSLTVAPRAEARINFSVQKRNDEKKAQNKEKVCLSIRRAKLCPGVTEPTERIPSNPYQLLISWSQRCGPGVPVVPPSGGLWLRPNPRILVSTFQRLRKGFVRDIFSRLEKGETTGTAISVPQHSPGFSTHFLFFISSPFPYIMSFSGFPFSTTMAIEIYPFTDLKASCHATIRTYIYPHISHGYEKTPSKDLPHVQWA